MIMVFTEQIPTDASAKKAAQSHSQLCGKQKVEASTDQSLALSFRSCLVLSLSLNGHMVRHTSFSWWLLFELPMSMYTQPNSATIHKSTN